MRKGMDYLGGKRREKSNEGKALLGEGGDCDRGGCCEGEGKEKNE